MSNIAETQFQGKALSHEHSALLLTEVIQHTINDENKPLYALFLDAKSAFDRALHQILCRRLFLDGTLSLEDWRIESHFVSGIKS